MTEYIPILHQCFGESDEIRDGLWRIATEFGGGSKRSTMYKKTEIDGLIFAQQKPGDELILEENKNTRLKFAESLTKLDIQHQDQQEQQQQKQQQQKAENPPLTSLVGNSANLIATVVAAVPIPKTYCHENTAENNATPLGKLPRKKKPNEKKIKRICTDNVLDDEDEEIFLV